jgi:hypothetical protein
VDTIGQVESSQVIDGRTWLELIDQARCWDLLAAASVGRIGVLVDSAPEIYPVNFAVDGRTIVFRTDPGNKLRGVDRSPSVCFEVDHIDPATNIGWSVLVKGRAFHLTRTEDIQRVSALGLQPWAIGRKAHWIQIRPDEVTGRRIHAIDE